VDSREPTNEKQNTAANGESWRVGGNTSLVCMIVCMIVYILAGSIEYELMTKIFGKPNVYIWRLQKNAVRMNMDVVFDLGEHFRMMDGWKSRRIVCRSMKLQKDTILEQGRVSKSDSHIARASLILIFEILEMVCNGLQTNWRDRIGLTSFYFYLFWSTGISSVWIVK